MLVAILTLALFCLAGLLYAEKNERLLLRLIFKPLLSALFLIVALMQKDAVTGYAAGVLGGLALSWIGDFCLIFESRRMFLGGLFAFLSAHLCYAAVFYGFGTFGLLTIAVPAVLAGPGVVIFLYLRPHLGQMVAPVIGYMIVITLMLGGALTLSLTSTFTVLGRGLVIAGAVLFYLSDILVARDKFVAPGFINRAIGLPLYYVAQFLLAFSIGVMK